MLAFLYFGALISNSIALPTDQGPSNEGVLITIPPLPTDTGLKQIPDANHPFIAPGPDDQRGPCPGMNTLANHGYMPRNGIVSFEQIVEASMEAFNFELNAAMIPTAEAMLSRGNPFTNQISIGLASPLVAPLPNQVDGPGIPGGMAKDGRNSPTGDVSLTRQDGAIGNNKDFQPDLFQEWLDIIAEVGGNSSVTGPRSIVNIESMSAIRLRRFQDSQTQNVKMDFHQPRFGAAYAEAAFVLTLFANGTTNETTVETLTSFFAHQTFPQNWFRTSEPLTTALRAPFITAIEAGNPTVVPGSNAPNGTFIPDPPPASPACASYQSTLANIPFTFANQTGIFGQNLKTLLDIVFTSVNATLCVQAPPSGPTGV